MRIKAPYLYLGFAVGAIILEFKLKYFHLDTTGAGMIMLFLPMIFAPGMVIWRLLRLKVVSIAPKLLYIIGLGFGYYFLINLVAIVTNLTIFQAGYLAFFLGIALFVISCWLDREAIWEPKFKDWFKIQTKADWFLYATILAGSVVAFLAIDAQVDKLIGDGWFHLAILQKITSGNGLNPYNLWVTKTTSLNPVYSFPLWHILVGLITKVLGTTIFTSLRLVLLPLVILTFVVWYSFSATIFKNKYLTALAFLSFLLLMLKDGTFYYLVPLASPDTFNRLLFLPLILGILIFYLFQEKASKITNTILISLLVIFMSLIHFTQLIYFIAIAIIAGILMAIFSRKKEALIKLGYILLGVGALTLPYLLIVQSGIISAWLEANRLAYQGDVYKNKTPQDANIVYRYAVLSLPIMALFFKKKSRLILPCAIVITSILISWQVFGLRIFLLKNLGQIFVERAIANIPAFIFFGFLLFLVIYGINYLVSKLSEKIILGINIAIGIFILLILIFGGFRTALASSVLKTVFNSDNIVFAQYFWVIFLLLAIGAVGYYFFRRKEADIVDPPHKLNFVLISLLLILIFATPYYAGLKKVFANNQNGTIFSNRYSNIASDIRTIGGQKTIDFLNSVPQRSVFITDNPTISQMILLYSNNLAAEYPYSVKEFSQSAQFYNNSADLEKRLAILKKLEVNYIFSRHPEDEQFLSSHPEFFKKVFTNDFDYPLVQNGLTEFVPVQYSFYQYLGT